MALIDKGAEVEEKDETGIEINEDSEIGQAVTIEEEKSNPDGGTADRKDEEIPGKEGSDLSEEKGDGNQVEVDPIQALNDKIADLEKRLAQPAPLAPEAKASTPTPPITEQEWEQYEGEWGVPRTAIKNTVDRIVNAVTDIKSYIDQRFSKIDREGALNTIAQDPNFTDAKKYSKEIEQYLQKVDPRYHSNADVLKDAVIWSRGMNYKKTVQNVRNEKEINKRISGVARPASGGSKGGFSKSAPSLTPLEKSAADAINMPHSEYANLKSKGNSARVIAH